MSLKSLEFHIKSDDYFGTLATVLNLVREKSIENGFTKNEDNVIKKVIQELVYLQDKYKILRK